MSDEQRADPLSKSWYRNWFICCMVALGAVFLMRYQVTPDALFAGILGFSIPAGIMLHGWLGHIH